MSSYTYIFEAQLASDASEDLHDFRATYSLSKHLPQALNQPEELPEIEVHEIEVGTDQGWKAISADDFNALVDDLVSDHETAMMENANEQAYEQECEKADAAMDFDF